MAGESAPSADAGFLSKLGDTLLGGINTAVDHRFAPRDPAVQVTQTPQGLVQQGTQQAYAGQSVPSWVWVAGLGGLALVIVLIARR